MTFLPVTECNISGMVDCRDVRHRILLTCQLCNVLKAGKFFHIKISLCFFTHN